ncbi:alpha/beta fold hydrolase [candidate division GN15 bacterium]|nr:alpha/beta fold hydrolase [candidate division GN15 bacterium]
MIDWKLTQEYNYKQGTVRYDIQGDGPPVVLVHGTPWSSFNWRHVVAALASSFSVYYYDLIGYGQSEKRDGQDVSLAVQNQVLAELLDHWGLDEPMIVGHDFGGTTVLRTHLIGKRSFERMVLVDPVAVAPWGSDFFRHVNQHEAVFQDLPPYIHEAVVTAYVRGAMHQPMPPDTLAGIVAPWLGPEGQRGFYRQIAQADQRFTDEVEPKYGSIDCPVLIVWGEEDQWIPIDRGRKLHAAMAESRFVSIPDAGHLVQEDAPAELVSQLLGILR